MIASDWVVIIGAIAAGVVAILRELRSVKGKLDVIHRDTDGSLTAVRQQLAATQSLLRRERFR